MAVERRDHREKRNKTVLWHHLEWSKITLRAILVSEGLAKL